MGELSYAELLEQAAQNNEGSKFAKARLAKQPQIRYPLYWTAFQELCTCRPVGMGMAPIPVDKIYWYAGEVLELTPRETEAFQYIIRSLDNYVLAHSAKQQAK